MKTMSAYVEAIMRLLGDQDPFAVLAATAERLAAQIRDLSAADLGRPESQDKWSVADVLQHLADSELVWAYRLRMTLAEDRPQLAGYDQDEWARRFRYSESTPRDALDLFAVCRRANLKLLNALGSADLDRVGVHSERGEESVRDMLSLYAGHDLVHLRQIDRIKRAHGFGR